MGAAKMGHRDWSFIDFAMISGSLFGSCVVPENYDVIWLLGASFLSHVLCRLKKKSGALGLAKAGFTYNVLHKQIWRMNRFGIDSGVEF